MKILLLNDNPVVNKLVTLSAQKTSDELTVAATVDEVESGSYDLIVIDDTLYTDNLLEELQAKISFSKSLYICSRDAESAEEFTSTLKKPFLPTDLVELFASFSRDVGSNAEEAVVLDDLDAMENFDESEDITDDLDSLDDLGDLGDLDDDDDSDIMNLDDIDLDDDEDGILDTDEAQKVKDLLDETSEDIEDLESVDDEDLDLDLDGLLDDEIDDELELEEDLELEEELELPDELEEEEEELELPDEVEEVEEELELPDELEEEEEDLEAQIESAVSELSEEDLQSEIDSLDGLTARDLKLAIGEDVDDLEEEPKEQIVDETDEQTIEEDTTQDTQDGVEALKNLLKALTDKNVAASMKGMKISINITLGDN